MKSRKRIALTLALALSGLTAPIITLWANGNDTLSGCYDVKHGSFSVARGQNPTDIVGMYRMLLIPKDSERKQKSIFLKGPLKGTPIMRTETGALTRHVLGTRKRIGTLTSGDDIPDEFIALSGSCPGSDGLPLLIEAKEIMNFSSGTGIFIGLTSGTIEWKGISNSCDDPNNRIADYELVSGIMCFQ